MAECIIKNGREELLKSYPIPLYEGESVPETEKSGNPKTFPEKCIRNGNGLWDFYFFKYERIFKHPVCQFFDIFCLLQAPIQILVLHIRHFP